MAIVVICKRLDNSNKSQQQKTATTEAITATKAGQVDGERELKI